MKIPVDHIVLEQFGYTNQAGDLLYVDLPRGLREGAVNEFAKTTVGSDPGGRRTNIRVLTFIKAWNFDDDEGVLLPLMSTLKVEGFESDPDGTPNRKTAEAKLFDAQVGLLEQIPIEIIPWIADRLVNKRPVTERTEAF